MTELRISGLVKAYDPNSKVLRGLDLTVPGGSLAAVLGPSGCGKTTLLRVIAGFLRADAGTVSVGGRVLSGPGTHVPPEQRRIGIVPQEGALFPHLSVARNVAFGLTGRSSRSGRDGGGGRTGKAERVRRTGEMLDLVGLAGYGDRMPHELSGGQQQRVALARALAPRPALVLLDEPFNALDSGLRAGVRADVCAALRASGATALLVTHDQQEALSTADLVAVVRDGRVTQSGTPQDIYRYPADPWVAGFVGDAILLPGTAGNGTATTALGPVRIRTPGAPGTPGGTGTPGEIGTPGETGTPGGPGGAAAEAASEGTVLLRPEQLELTEPAGDIPRGTVKDVRYYGHDAMVTLAVDSLDTPINVRVAGPVSVHPGDHAGIRVTGEAILHRRERRP
jgi:iron(III) transport system ATP-binding protein